jgi:hypothetical protein
VPRLARIVEPAARKRDRDNVWNWPIMLKKSFLGDERNFLGLLLIRFA